MQSTLLLVHGGMHGAWCWAPAIEALEKRGRRAIAVDLPGHGDDRTPLAEISLASYAERVTSAIDAEEGPITLVGHSMGGAPITLAAHERPGRIAALVYVAAFVPVSGESMERAVRKSPSDSEAIVSMAADGLSMLLKPGAATELMYHDCPPDVAAAAVGRLRPLPLRPLLEPMPSLSIDAPTGFILTLDDRTMPPPVQQMHIGRLPEPQTIEIRGSHSPFMANPAAFADVLLELEARLIGPLITESSARKG